MIANSLGSDYTFKTVWFSLYQLLKHYGRYLYDIIGISYSNERIFKHLQVLLMAYVPGVPFLFYKGRDAIEFTLRAYQIEKNDAVLTQAFTCYAIEEAIQRAGSTPFFVDLAEDSFNPDVDQYEKAYQQALKEKLHPKAVIVQHTLGYVAPIEKIAQWAKKRKLLLIEDVAQAVGAKTSQGKFVGTYGDVTIFSFGRDKIIDAVSGGAAVFQSIPDSPLPPIGTVPRMAVTRDLLYPVITWLIRTTYSFGLGKVLHVFAKKLELITNPILSPTQAPAHLPASLAALAVVSFEKIEQTIQSRRKKSSSYHQKLSQFLKNQIPVDLNHASNIRYSCLVPTPSHITATLSEFGYHLTDRWYRQAVDCGSLEVTSSYIAGSCPNAENLARHIINLPTHHAVSESHIAMISDLLHETLEETT